MFAYPFPIRMGFPAPDFLQARTPSPGCCLWVAEHQFQPQELRSSRGVKFGGVDRISSNTKHQHQKGVRKNSPKKQLQWNQHLKKIPEALWCWKMRVPFFAKDQPWNQLLVSASATDSFEVVGFDAIFARKAAPGGRQWGSENSWTQEIQQAFWRCWNFGILLENVADLLSVFFSGYITGEIRRCKVRLGNHLHRRWSDWCRGAAKVWLSVLSRSFTNFTYWSSSWD